MELREREESTLILVAGSKTGRVGASEKLGTKKEQLTWGIIWLVGSVLKLSGGHPAEKGQQAL